MKKKPVQGFVILGISALILLSPAFLHMVDLAETKISPADLSFENSDRDDTLSSQVGQSKVIALILFSFERVAGTILFAPATDIGPLIPFLDHEASPLRC